jgi:hypothetical protein
LSWKYFAVALPMPLELPVMRMVSFIASTFQGCETDLLHVFDARDGEAPVH